MTEPDNVEDQSTPVEESVEEVTPEEAGESGAEDREE